MAFESGVGPEGWRSALIVPLYKGKGDRNECKNYIGVKFLSVVSGILVERVRRVTGGLIDDEQRGFRKRMGCIDQIFTINSIG